MTVRSSRWVVFVVALAALALTVPAVAMANSEPPPGQQDDVPPTEEELFDRLTPEQEIQVIELIDEGEAAHDAGDFDTAIDAFHEVHELFPHARITYRLALAYEHAGDYERAIQYYEFFQEQDPHAEERGEVARTIRRLDEELGDDRTMVRVETMPIGADIYLDDRDTVPVGQTPQWVTVEPGEHKVIVDKSGYQSESTTIEIAEGADEIVEFDLSGGDVEEEDETDAPSTEGPAVWKPAVTFALVGVGGLFTYLSFQEYGAARHMEANLDDPNSDYTQDDVDASRAMGFNMGVAAGLTLAAGTAFTIWWATRDRSGPGSGVSVAPTPDGIHVGFTHRF